MVSIAAPEQKKGMFGFGKKKQNEVELASEEFRARPFTDTVEPEAVPAPHGVQPIGSNTAMNCVWVWVCACVCAPVGASTRVS
jgi:hypothetical protein